MKDAYDIVVIGGGGAGLMAALMAARQERDVLLLEKDERLGGTTGMSVGTISTTRTPHQRAMGITDSSDAHFEDMGLFAGPLEERDNLELRRLLVNEVPETFRILCECGIDFIGPIPEPPHRHPRLHAIVPHSRGYIHHLSGNCRRSGAEILTGARAVGLRRENGRVVGVEARLADGNAGTRTISARRAVILATGDFSSAPAEYKARFFPRALMPVEGVNAASTGDGQRLGEEAGGEVVNGDLAWGPEIRFVPPPRASLVSRLPPFRSMARAVLLAMKTLPDAVLRPFLMSFVTTYLAPSHTLFDEGAVMVNKLGTRFCDELDRPQDSISHQPDGEAYFILDSRIARRFDEWPNYISTAPGVGYAYLSDYRRSRHDVFFQADTLEALSEKIGIPSGALAAAVEEHNNSLKNRGDARAQLTEASFYALGPAKSWIVFSEGGLRIDSRMRVLDADGEPIAGLYAAGSCGQGGAILNGHGHHLGWAFTSGRLAGTYAAQQPLQ